MKIIFMGTPDFAVPTLQALIDAGHEILCVVAQPDKPKGRGKQLVSPPTIELARAHNIPTRQPKAVRSGPFVEWIKNAGADVAVVIAYGRILTKEVLEAPKYGCINVHASLLPKYRGAAPIHWAIIQGETTTGVCTMQMDEGMDTGDVLLREEIDILEEETTEELWERLSKLGAGLCVKTLANLPSITPTPQPHDQATMAPLITKETGLIDWNQGTEVIHNLIRGCVSWPVAQTSFRGNVLKIWKSKKHSFPTGTPGSIVQLKPNPLVATLDGALELIEVQLPNKNKTAGISLVNGAQLALGERLGDIP